MIAPDDIILQISNTPVTEDSVIDVTLINHSSKAIQIGTGGLETFEYFNGEDWIPVPAKDNMDILAGGVEMDLPPSEHYDMRFDLEPYIINPGFYRLGKKVAPDVWAYCEFHVDF